MVVDVTTFRLAAGVDEERLPRRGPPLAEPSWCRTATVSCAGRRLRRHGEWVVITLWATEADAAAFEAETAGHEVRRAFDRTWPTESRRAARYDTLD